MADDRYRQDHHNQQQSASRHQTNPNELQRRAAGTPSNMAASVTLPSIHDPRTSGYGPPPPPPNASQNRGYTQDPRYEASRDASNGYPPSGHQPPPPAGGHLPAPQYHQPDPRSPAYPPPDQRGYYGEQRGHPAPYPHDPYRQDGYYYPGPPPPPGYAPYGPDGRMAYGPPGQGQAQAAPRQRTSIACRYCRKRKIRCSGYQSAPGGKCQNCARMGQECIFQPVSNSSSAAFIPVSAVPGGVPPGTPLYGAYGQPLAPAHHQPYPPGPPPPPNGPHGPPPQHYAHPGPYHQPAAHSPTESYSSYGDPRSEEAAAAGRRRRRTSEENDEGYRLPPPRTSGEEDPRRRSPAEFSNNSSPSGFGHSQHSAGARHSPRGPPLPQPSTGAAQAPPSTGGRSPGVANGSSGASTPGASGQGAQPSQQAGGSSVMSLSNLVDKNDIDQGMINRLNRPKAPGAPPSNASNASR